MRTRALFAATALAFAATPCLAAQDKPITDEEPDAVDVVKTPVTDLNLDKQDIPAVLIEAQANPYDLSGLKRCRVLRREVELLDETLGPDLDLPEEDRTRITAGRVAKSVVAYFVPFRGIIREVSGANEHQRKVRAAIQAGMARRGFLKGVGQAKGCAWPARPATQKDIAAHLADQTAREDSKQDAKSRVN